MLEFLVLRPKDGKTKYLLDSQVDAVSKAVDWTFEQETGCTIFRRHCVFHTAREMRRDDLVCVWPSFSSESGGAWHEIEGARSGPRGSPF